MTAVGGERLGTATDFEVSTQGLTMAQKTEAVEVFRQFAWHLAEKLALRLPPAPRVSTRDGRR
jgi:hypothetical protein